MQITEVRVSDYNWSIICVFGVLFPFNTFQFQSFLWFKHRTMQQTERDDRSDFNFVLAESSSSKNKCSLFRCILDAFIVTQYSFSWPLSIATAAYVPFMYRWFRTSIPDRSCIMLTEDKNLKRDTNALDVILFLPLWQIGQHMPQDDSFILSANNLAIVSVLKN